MYVTRDYGITYLFHDRRDRANMGYEQRDKLVTLGHASVGVGYGTLSHCRDCVEMKDRKQK